VFGSHGRVEDRLVDMSVKKKLEEFNNLVGTVGNCCCVQVVWEYVVVWYCRCPG
jgi:hypothetical protein